MVEENTHKACQLCAKPVALGTDGGMCGACGATVCDEHLYDQPRALYTDDPELVPKTEIGANLGQHTVIMKTGCKLCLAEDMERDARIRSSLDVAVKTSQRSNRKTFLAMLGVIAVLGIFGLLKIYIDWFW